MTVTPLVPVRFDNRIAVITGAARGLGQVWARALAARGAMVVAVGRQPENTAALVAAIHAEGGKAEAEFADVTDPAALKALADRVMERHGKVDILVNNAGMTRDRSFAKIDLADFKSAIDTNLMGAVNTTAAFWPGMLTRGYGRVIFLTSSAGLAGNFGQSAYGAAKIALVGLMQTLGIEGARKGIRVNCFAPIGMTDMNAAVLPAELAELFDPELLAPGLLFLASEAAPDRTILMGGAGSYECARITFTRGRRIGGDIEELAARIAEIADPEGAIVPRDARTQAEIELANTQTASS